MKKAIKRKIRIFAAAILCFACAASFAFASESDSPVLLNPHGSEGALPINPVVKEGVSHLFLPSGTTEEDLVLPEGRALSDYETMTDENIGSLHFFSDDPVNKGMRYINSSRDHSTKAPGRVVLLDKNLNVEYEGGVEAIKGRGNRTWYVEDKKPYQIKLNEKVNLLNLSDVSQKAKKWILLANAFDTTLIRNQIAYSMAKEMGLENSPEGRHVDLYYDGEYLGVYYLCEKVEIGEGRVDIADPDKTPESIQGGYLLELDNAYYRTELYSFEAFPAGHFVIKSPEEPTKQQFGYIESFVKEAMSIIAAGGRDEEGDFVLFDYVDRETCVKYFLSMVWIQNEDVFATSTYMYKPAGEDKLYFGPVWDCDFSMGKSSVSMGFDEWLIRGIGQKLMKVPEFRQALKDEYEAEMMPLLKEVLLGQRQGIYLKSFDAMANEMYIPAVMNTTALDFKRGTNRITSYQKSMDALETWLVGRSEWFETKVYDENFVSGTKKENAAAQPTNALPAADNALEVTTGIKADTNTFAPGKPRLKATAKKKALNLSWSKVKGAKGYQIRYCKGTSAEKWKYKTVNKNRYKLKKLKKKTKYSVQVRAYCVNNGTKHYGMWTNALKKTTK
ncbi:MAG: CotH kinase family protein [Firmicutes bacterium]|nr:CotH kinase family protein [Bacillota bacterium]